MKASAPITWLTSRLLLRVLDENDALLMVGYHQKNREHLAPSAPLREERDSKSWQAELGTRHERSIAKEALHLGLFLRSDVNSLVGEVNLTNVIRGVFQACHLGFSVDVEHTRKGLMFEALEKVLHIAFVEWRLHRVMANHLPENIASSQLLEKLGFAEEGLAKSYLQIAGRWRDHVLRSKISSEDLIN